MSRTAVLCGILTLVLTVVFSDAPRAAITFEDLLIEASLEFTAPEQYGDVQPEANSVMLYERALRRQDKALEIRYAIRPIARARVEYEDPHNAAPDPDHIFAMMFRTLVDSLAAGGNTPVGEFSTDQARAQFNADWAAAAVFDVAESFSRDFRQGLLIAMHKNGQADAYMIFLFDDYAQVKTAIKKNMSTLRFR